MSGSNGGTDASVAALWRYPVKSMMGEQLNATEVTTEGIIGDRRFALIDRASGMVVSAKNPRKWPGFFDNRAAFISPPTASAALPPVRITLRDGSSVTSEQVEMSEVLSAALGSEVVFARLTDDARTPGTTQAEEYWPDIDGLDHRDTVTAFDLPTGSFFDAAPLHLVTTATLERMRELYPAGRFEARRFRPNIVVATADGTAGFVEDDWMGRTLRIGEQVRLRVVGPCPRCVMTTLEQDDLPRDVGILRAAAQGHQANVGVYAETLAAGFVRRGDRVTVD